MLLACVLNNCYKMLLYHLDERRMILAQGIFACIWAKSAVCNRHMLFKKEEEHDA